MRYQLVLQFAGDSLANYDAMIALENVLIADDLIATGGTALAAAKLVEELGGNVIGFAIMVELSSLGGSKLLQNKGYPVHSMVIY